MNPDEKLDASRANADLAATTLMGWVVNAKKLLDGGKLDGLATARIGELLLNACRYLSEREEAAKKAAELAKRQAESKVRAAEYEARSLASLRMALNSK